MRGPDVGRSNSRCQRRRQTSSPRTPTSTTSTRASGSGSGAANKAGADEGPRRQDQRCQVRGQPPEPRADVIKSNIQHKAVFFPQSMGAADGSGQESPRPRARSCRRWPRLPHPRCDHRLREGALVGKSEGPSEYDDNAEAKRDEDAGNCVRSRNNVSSSRMRLRAPSRILTGLGCGGATRSSLWSEGAPE